MSVADRIMFWDLETENQPFHGAIASPRNPNNYVVLNGWAIDKAPYDGPIEYIYNRDVAEAKSRPWIHIPDDVWLIVMHNAPFEADWLLVQQRPEFMAFLERGGRIFCTAYAHYLLSNQRDTYPSLNEIAPLYGGEHKVDGVKALWEAGKRTSEIDPALLLDYLINPKQGDVANTRTIFYQQYAQLTERGMWQMALERMEGMLFCCFAMDAGLFTDKAVAFKQLEEGEARLKELQEFFHTFRTGYPEGVEFKESSDHHMSAWLFGGPIKYRHKVPKFNEDQTPVWEKGDFVTLTSHDNMKVQLNEAGAMPVNLPTGIAYFAPEQAEFDFGFAFERYKSGKNKGMIKVTREDTQVQKRIWADTYHMAPALVDMALLPESIKDQFYKDYTGKRFLLDGSPVFSTGKDALEVLKVRKEFPENVRAVLANLDEFNKLDKDMGTYYLRNEVDDDGNVTKQSGMLQYLTDMSIVHHVLNCTSTVTTRLSSNRPNMQNLPRGNTSNVKKMFTSRYDNEVWLAWAVYNDYIGQDFFDECIRNIRAGIRNGWIVEADYSALEVVTLAAFSQDKALIKALLDGVDMHCLRLSAQLKRPYEEIKAIHSDQNHPEFKEIDRLRTDIKPKAFAYQYGATAQGIAFATGCTVEDAQAFIDAEKATFPEVEAFFDASIYPQVHATSINHREQADDGSWRIFQRGHWQSPGGTCYEFRQYPKTIWAGGKKTQGMAYKPTQIRNYPIQGESGFFVQGICGKVIRWLIASNFFGNRVFVINTVHDAIYLDCHRSVLDQVCAGVKAIMESLPAHFSQAYGYNLNVPFPAAVEFGSSMHEKIHWHEGVLQAKGL